MDPSVSHLTDDAFGASGRRPFFEYRDVGIREATHGAYNMQVVRARSGEHQVTGWHYHTCDLQIVYCLNGWEDLGFEDGRVVRLEPGSCVNIPPGYGHVELGYSDDMEVLVISSPGTMGTVEIDPPVELRR
ncbi:MAG: cupin domain-containing protein [Ilumatobacteraceae bacterium]|nr:cupin domain-containing protein [Ilumatobacteraceae bacterium]